LALLNLNSNQSYRDAPRVHPALLDGSFQALALTKLFTLDDWRQANTIYLPWFINIIQSRRAIQEPVWCYTELDRESDEVIRGTTSLLSQQGEVLLTLDRVLLRRLDANYQTPEQMRLSVPQAPIGQTSMSGTNAPKTTNTNVIYETLWKPIQSEQKQGIPRGTWLIFRMATVAHDVVERLVDRGNRVISVHPGNTYHNVGDTIYLSPDDTEAYTRLQIGRAHV
jgi:hypothetical protein